MSNPSQCPRPNVSVRIGDTLFPALLHTGNICSVISAEYLTAIQTLSGPLPYDGWVARKSTYQQFGTTIAPVGNILLDISFYERNIDLSVHIAHDLPLPLMLGLDFMIACGIYVDDLAVSFVPVPSDSLKKPDCIFPNASPTDQVGFELGLSFLPRPSPPPLVCSPSPPAPSGFPPPTPTPLPGQPPPSSPLPTSALTPPPQSVSSSPIPVPLPPPSASSPPTPLSPSSPSLSSTPPLPPSTPFPPPPVLPQSPPRPTCLPSPLSHPPTLIEHSQQPSPISRSPLPPPSFVRPSSDQNSASVTSQSSSLVDEPHISSHDESLSFSPVASILLISDEDPSSSSPLPVVIPAPCPLSPPLTHHLQSPDAGSPLSSAPFSSDLSSPLQCFHPRSVAKSSLNMSPLPSLPASCLLTGMHLYQYMYRFTLYRVLLDSFLEERLASPGLSFQTPPWPPDCLLHIQLMAWVPILQSLSL